MIIRWILKIITTCYFLSFLLSYCVIFQYTADFPRFFFHIKYLNSIDGGMSGTHMWGKEVPNPLSMGYVGNKYACLFVNIRIFSCKIIHIQSFNWTYKCGIHFDREHFWIRLSTSDFAQTVTPSPCWIFTLQPHSWRMQTFPRIHLHSHSWMRHQT